jgi:uncharacterized membrane protein
MNKGRLEPFSDGVFAIIITIMVLDLRVPTGPSLEALRSMVPVFLSYVLSFVYVGIYWNNLHHLLHASEHVSGPILWANLHLLFWLSLAPFATRWVGENYNAPGPIALYGVMLLFAGVAYFILTKALVAHHGASSRLATSIGKDREGLASVVIYLIAILRVRLVEGGLRLLHICSRHVAPARPKDREVCSSELVGAKLFCTDFVPQACF